MFEFDLLKSMTNLAKHGIDFVDAQELWKDTNLLEIQARFEDEQRYIFIGLLNGKHWSAVTTLRKDKIRLISVRRSRTKERQLYES